MDSILTSAFIFQSCLSLGITTVLADQRYVCFLVLPAFVQLYSSTDSSNTFTASSVGQDDSCTICTAQYSGSRGPFSALLIHSIKTSGLVTDKEDSTGRKWDPSLLPGACLLPCIRESKKANRAGCVQGRSWNSARTNGKDPDGCGNSHDGSQIKTKWKQNHMPRTLRSLALFLSLPFSWLLPQVFLSVWIIVCYSITCMPWITITPLLH